MQRAMKIKESWNVQAEWHRKAHNM